MPRSTRTTPRKKTPQKDLTRSDGIPLALQRLLILACEEEGLSNAQPADVCESNSIFGGANTDLRKRCRQKVRHFRTLREEDPDIYWDLYVKAQAAVTQGEDVLNVTDSNAKPDKVVSLITQGLKKVNINTKQSSQLKKSVSTQKQSTTMSAVNGVQLNEETVFAPLPEPPNFLIYDSMKEAEDACDFAFTIDMERPEGTCPHVSVTVIKDQQIGNESVGMIKICYTHLIDIRDYPLCNLWVVCNGRGLVLQTPAVPRWQLDENCHLKSELDFHLGSAKIEQSHKVAFNDIARDKDRLSHFTLLVVPDDFTATGQLEVPLTINGEKVANLPRDVAMPIKTAGGSEYSHVFRPISWLIRNVSQKRQFLSLNEKVKTDDPFKSDQEANNLKENFRDGKAQGDEDGMEEYEFLEDHNQQSPMPVPSSSITSSSKRGHSSTAHSSYVANPIVAIQSGQMKRASILDTKPAGVGKSSLQAAVSIQQDDDILMDGRAEVWNYPDWNDDRNTKMDHDDL